MPWVVPGWLRVGMVDPGPDTILSVDENLECIFAEPGASCVAGFPGGLELQLDDALFFDDDFVEGSSVGDKSHLATQALVFNEGTRAVVSADLLVGGDRKSERDSGRLEVEVAEELEQDCHDPFHVTRTRSTNASVLEVRLIGFAVGVMDDIDMTEHENLGLADARGQSHEGNDIVALVIPNLDMLQRLEVITHPGNSLAELIGSLLGSRNQDEITRQGDESFAKAGGIERSVDERRLVEGWEALVAIEGEVVEGEDVLDLIVDVDGVAPEEEELSFADQSLLVEVEIDGDDAV